MLFRIFTNTPKKYELLKNFGNGLKTREYKEFASIRENSINLFSEYRFLLL